MSDASDKLDRNRHAILEYVARRQRKHDPREEPASGGYPGMGDGSEGYAFSDEPALPGSGWFGHLSHALRTWWRYHPAHMAVDLASPLMHEYARRKPLQLIGISLAAGAALTFARPWRLISLSAIVVALLKSSQLSHLLMAAMSAADYRKDHNRPQ
jgi:hypothetical protein